MKTESKHTPGPSVEVWKDGKQYGVPVDMAIAAPELVRFAHAIEDSVNDALRPGSRDTFMTLVKRLQDYRAWARAIIAKAEGR